MQYILVCRCRLHYVPQSAIQDMQRGELESTNAVSLAKYAKMERTSTARVSDPKIEEEIPAQCGRETGSIPLSVF